MKKIDLSIIIINYNTKVLLRQCLKSLMPNAQCPMPNAEIIVVDNGSSDSSVGTVEREFSKVKLIKNKTNLGYAKANNQALKRVKGKYILFLNTDTVIPPKTIPVLISYFEKHPEVGVVTPKLKLRDGKIDPDCHRGFPTPRAAFCYFTGLEKLSPRSKFFGQYHQTWKNFDTIHEIDACCGAFLLTRKKILDRIGSFDESYFFYGEDLDLCYRVKQNGWKIVYYSQVEAIHYKGASSNLRKESKDVARTSGADRIKVARSSAQAMGIFYNKFYKDKYPFLITILVKLGIEIKKNFRIISAILSTSNNRRGKFD